MVPLCDEGPKSAVITPAGAGSRVGVQLCFFAVVEHGEVEIDDLASEPGSRTERVEGVKVEKIGACLDGYVTGGVGLQAFWEYQGRGI